MIAMAMMFWTYEYKHIRPSGRIARRGERLTLCLCVSPQDSRTCMRLPGNYIDSSKAHPRPRCTFRCQALSLCLVLGAPVNVC